MKSITETVKIIKIQEDFWDIRCGNISLGNIIKLTSFFGKETFSVKTSFTVAGENQRRFGKEFPVWNDAAFWAMDRMIDLRELLSGKDESTI